MLKLSLKMIFRSRRMYTGYLLAIILSVATFLSFAFLLFHPDIHAKDLPDTIGQVLVFGEIGIGIFAVFFIIFFHSFLLRLRSKEFGIFLSLGISHSQLKRMVRLESATLAVIGFVIGLIVGVVGTYGTFHLMGFALNITPLEPIYSPYAVLYSTVFFIVTFSIDTYLSTKQISKISPKKLLNDSRKNQRMPVYSKKKFAMAIVSIGLGYSLALWPNAGVNIFPIIVLCSIGTYLLFSQSLGFVLNKVRLRTTDGMMLLGVSRISYRVSDFARVLTSVTLLSTASVIVMSASSSALSYIDQIAQSPQEKQMLLGLVAIFMFICFFLVILYFIAAVSILYVKLHTQIDEDRKQLNSLRRIGLSLPSIRKMIYTEIAFLFFVPTLVILAHSSVAMIEYTTKIAPKNASSAGAWKIFCIVVITYLFIYALFYLFARKNYIKQLTSLIRF